MGHDEGPGHCEIRYTDCRVPESNLLGERGAGFVIAQDRLGPGRIHHCMRAIGTAERAIEMMCERANSRESFGGPLADKQFVQDFIAKSRMEVDQARLLTLYAAWQMDTEGKRRARQAISMIKVVAANVVMDVLDRAIQVHGSLGMSDDTPARRDVALQANAARRGRPRRGPQDGDRPPRAQPRGEASRRRRATAREAPDRRRARRAGQGDDLAPPARLSASRPMIDVARASTSWSCRELLDRRDEPADTAAAVDLERLAARGGQLDNRPAAVLGVRAALDQPVTLELADGLRHRLGAHLLGGREIADARRPLAIESAEDRALVEGEAMLGPQPPHQLAQDDAQLARGTGGVGPRLVAPWSSRPSPCAEYTSGIDR